MLVLCKIPYYVCLHADGSLVRVLWIFQCECDSKLFKMLTQLITIYMQLT